MLGAVKSWYSSLNLIRQFMLMAIVLVLMALGVLGYFVTTKIEESIKNDVKIRAAVYMENFLLPHLQELSTQDALSAMSIKSLDDAFLHDSKVLFVEEARVWNLQGKVLYSTDKTVIGQTFPISPDLANAAAGIIDIGFEDDPHDATAPRSVENAIQLFEIYVPMMDLKTGKVLAIGEFYQNAESIKKAISVARIQSWGVTGLVSLALLFGLRSVVARGNEIIVRQKVDLDNRVASLSDLLQQNEKLRSRSERATQRLAEDSEIHLKRIGSDLHDGVGQLIALALLKLDKLFAGLKTGNSEHELVRSMLNDAMTEIRDMSAGLALPEMEKISLAQAIELITKRHERRTGTKVTVHTIDPTLKLSQSIKLCLCRFVQEGLSNAFNHGGGVGQEVLAYSIGTTIAAEVRDQGPGFSSKKSQKKRQSLGLLGLKNRLESLGGELTVDTKQGRGTILTAKLPFG